VEERLRHWSKTKLRNEGVTLYNLRAKLSGYLFSEVIIHVSVGQDEDLPYHKFSQGDMVSVVVVVCMDILKHLKVMLSRNNPLTEQPFEGVILDKKKKLLSVVAKEYPEDIASGLWVCIPLIFFSSSKLKILL